MSAKQTQIRAADIASLVDASDDAIIGKGLDGRIISWSRAAERIYGYSAEEALGQPIALIVPEDRTGEPADIIARVLAGERIDALETVRMARDGTMRDVSLFISPVRDTGGEIVSLIVLARDVTDRRADERALVALRETERKRNLVLSTANRVALDILSSRTGVEALRHIADAAREIAGARYAALGVANPDGDGLQEFVTCGLTADEEAAIGPRPTGRGVLNTLLHRTEPLRIEVLGNDPGSVGFPPGHPPMDAFLGVPIRRGRGDVTGTALGSLYLTNKVGGGSFTAIDEAAVEALGSHAAVAIQNLHTLARQRRLVSGLIAAQEEERRSVAYDLHDGLTQYVMAANAHLQAFRRANGAGKQEKAAAELDQGLSFLKDAVVESRRLVNGLRSLALDDLGLAGALEQLIFEEKQRSEWTDADLVHNIAGLRFDRSLETTAFRVVQEALSNVRKHADAARVRVALLWNQAADGLQEHLTLEVRDWGAGFNAVRRVDYDHVGLQSMAERVHLVNGTFTLKSDVGSGTVVSASFPLPPRETDENEADNRDL